MFTIDELRDWIGSPSEDDGKLELLLSAAIADVELHTGEYYGPVAERVVILPGNGTDTLFLSGNPVAVTEVLEYAEVGGSPLPLAAIEPSGWVLRGNKLLRKGGYGWFPGFEYQVTYDAGYVPGTEPPLVRQTVKDLVMVRYNTQGGEDIQSESLGDYSYSLGSSSGDSGVTAVLNRLPRRIRV